MTGRAGIVAVGLILFVAACAPTWKHDSGPHTLSSSTIYVPPPAEAPEANASGGATGAAPGKAHDSRPVAYTIPDGWHWFDRGDDLIATRDGVFLQQIFIERIHVDQIEQPVMGAFPLAAVSAKQWPTRTAKSLKKRFAAGMAPADAAEVLLESRRNDPAVKDLAVQKVVTRTVAGRQAFRATFVFRLKMPLMDPSPLYRTAYCGFMDGEWFYGVSYTAAVRHYFDRDLGAFETFLESFRLVEK